MKTFTIDDENNITAFATREEAAATTTTPFDCFASQNELAELAAAWPAERLVAIWNGLPGVKPVKGFKNPKVRMGRIWERIQRLGEAEKPKAEHKAKRGGRVAKGATAKATATKKATPAKNLGKATKKTKTASGEAVGKASKAAAVLAMLERKGGATLAEIMQATGWQAHSVRGFISGVLGKKLGHTVESAKRDHERVYSIAK